VTIPADIRHALGLKEGDTVAFELENNTVRIAPRGSVVARTAGALKSDAPLLAPEEERAAAEQAIAEDVVQRMGI
jgi:AbrB family looped-hinge helix DNA binding protein